MTTDMVAVSALGLITTGGALVVLGDTYDRRDVGVWMAITGLVVFATWKWILI